VIERIYIDGEVAGAVPTRGLTLSASSVSEEPARLGSKAKEHRRDEGGLRGMLDEVAIFPRALSDEEVRTLYRMGSQSDTLAGGSAAKSPR
jgi:hypothetical protein